MPDDGNIRQKGYNMKDIFINTLNFKKMQELTEELYNNPLGVEMAAVVGRAGRGKTTSAEKIYSANPNTVYVLYQEDWTYMDVLRDMAFRLGGSRPRYRQQCFEIIQNEMESRRRMIMVDEADRMPIKVLNGLRNIHDIMKIPVVLIGEEALIANLNRERRLISRIRDMIHFEPIGSTDVVIFYGYALDLKITQQQSVRLLKHSGGDFRNIKTDALKAERILISSGASDAKSLPDSVIDQICGNGKK